MHKENPKISIVTITYNCEQSVEKTIQSVVNQDYDNLEYIIIDGASTDGTLKVVDRYKDKIAVVVSEADKGISDAFNKGIDKATGDIVMFLNSGDYLVENNILKQVASDWIEDRKDVIFYNVKRGNGTVFVPDADVRGEDTWNKAEVPHQGAFVKREVFEQIGKFNINYKLRMDYDFWARCLKERLSYKYISRVIVNYEVGGSSMQASNAKLFYKEGFEIKKKYGMKISLEERVYAAIPGWVRKLKKK